MNKITVEETTINYEFSRAEVINILSRHIDRNEGGIASGVAFFMESCSTKPSRDFVLVVKTAPKL